MSHGKHRRPIPTAQRARSVIVDSAAVATTTAMVVAVGVAAVSEYKNAKPAAAAELSSSSQQLLVNELRHLGIVLPEQNGQAELPTKLAHFLQEHPHFFQEHPNWFAQHPHWLQEHGYLPSTATSAVTKTLTSAKSADPTPADPKPAGSTTSHPAPTATPSATPTKLVAAHPALTPSPTPTSATSTAPKPVATATPKPTPTATPTPTPTTATTSTSTSAISGWPNAANTGVPAGTALKASGSLTVTTPGATINGLDINGCVTIQAANVKITNTRIRCSRAGAAVKVASGSVTLSHSEIDGLGRTDECIGFSNYTLLNVNIHGCVDGIKMTSNDTIEASYVHDLARLSGSHNDTIQIQDGSNDVVKDNVLQAYDAATNDPMNSSIQTGVMLGPLSNVLVEHNYMDGGNYTVNAGGGSGANGYPVSGYVFKSNVFGHDFRFGPVMGLGPGITFDSSNVWASNGQPVH